MAFFTTAISSLSRLSTVASKDLMALVLESPAPLPVEAPSVAVMKIATDSIRITRVLIFKCISISEIKLLKDFNRTEVM